MLLWLKLKKPAIVAGIIVLAVVGGFLLNSACRLLMDMVEEHRYVRVLMIRDARRAALREEQQRQLEQQQKALQAAPQSIPHSAAPAPPEPPK